jgi:hypothetical protein
MQQDMMGQRVEWTCSMGMMGQGVVTSGMEWKVVMLGNEKGSLGLMGGL